MNDRVHRLYRWEMHFASGEVYSGMAGSTPFDPNNIPHKYGPLIMIKLIPRDADSNLPTIPFTIPGGTEGFHNRDVLRLSNGHLTGLAFRVGYRTDNGWCAICVNASDGSVYWEGE